MRNTLRTVQNTRELSHQTSSTPDATPEHYQREQNELPEEAEDDDKENTLTPENDDLEKQDLELQQTKSTIAQSLSLPREILFIACVCLAQFMTQAGLGQTMAIIHVIGADYNITNPGILSWLIAGYSLTVSTFILLSGRLGDVFGYKKMFIIGFAWFAIWSMIAGLAVYSSYKLFIFARVLQGIGPSISLPNGLAILGATYPAGNRKNLCFALFGACAPVGSIFGSVGASLLALAWWPWAFWTFALVLAAITVVSIFVIPDPKRRTIPEKSLSGLFEQLDALGGLTGVTALVLFNFAWNQSGVVGWDRPETITCLILGVLLTPVFFYIEMRVATNPLIPFSAFTSDVSFVCACIACGWSCFGIWYYYAWSFMLVIKGASPLLASAWICPVAISGALASVGTGILIGLLRPAWLMVISMTVFLVGTIILMTTPPDQIYWGQLFVISVVMPWAMDMSFPAATIIMSNAVDKKHQGVAASLIATIVNYSISLGLGFGGTIEGHVNNGGRTKADLLKGYRGAEYFACGLAGLGVLVSLCFLAKSYWKDRKSDK